MSVFVGAGNGQGLPGQSTHKVTINLWNNLENREKWH